VHFERTWLDPESGKAFCLSTGPSKEAIMRVHERAGHPTTEVYELTSKQSSMRVGEACSTDRRGVRLPCGTLMGVPYRVMGQPAGLDRRRHSPS
jgi:hypothetical protein